MTQPPTATPAPRLLLGPLLRYVDERRATVWVETDSPCEVSVLGARTRTWTVHGHHYALVQVDGLEPASTYEYDVHLDGTRAWPPPDSPYPPSVVRTLRQDGTVRLAFGSCRRTAPFDTDALRTFGADALVAMAERMAEQVRADGDRSAWPDALFLAGDQVYADMPSEPMVERLRRAHAEADADHEEIQDEIWDYEEYTWLYRESWTPEPVRWLLSTVPTCMLLDDHDLRDDWNTSASWRRHVTAQPWWRDRVVGAFASYWVHQHLGNLSPDELEDDPTWRMVRSVDDDAERTRRLDEFAFRSDAEPGSARWSFHRDLGGNGTRVRLVAVDSRCSRRLDPDDRSMLDDAEWAWLRRTVLPADGERPVDHLLLGSTLPFLMVPGIHHAEGWDEAVAQGAWGRWPARAAEVVRQAIDLEHWAAFRASLHRVVDLLAEVCRGPRPPASILLLSGDVHCSYTARAQLDDVPHPGTAVHQLTMSPFRNPLHLPLRLANRLAQARPVEAVTHALARAAGVRDVAARWDVDGGLWFDNGVMTIAVDGRTATLEVEHATVEGGRQVLRRTATTDLTGPAAPRRRRVSAGRPRPAARRRRPQPTPR
ncbi:DUF7800 domain-containing protein [Thalassiella azotivora]